MTGPYFWKRVLVLLILLTFTQVLVLYIGSASARSQTPTTTTRFVPVATWNHQGGQFPSAQERVLAKYSFSDLDRKFYIDTLGQNTWQVLKASNPAHQIYVYELGFATRNDQDATSVEWLYNISRWNNARGHSMGNLNTQNPDLFLLDASGNRILISSSSWILDLGVQKYVDYWLEAVTADITNQPWKADGIFIDGPWFRLYNDELSGTPVKYTTDAAWTTAAIYFAQKVSAGLHAQGVKVWYNGGASATSSQAGQAACRTLDASSSHPDVLLDEGAFVSQFAAAGILASVYSESQCKATIDTMQSVKNMGVAVASAVNGLPGDTGIDSYSKPITYWDAFYYGLGCFLLGKNTVANNSYFVWHDNNAAVQWFSEFDINLGAAKGAYQVSPYGTSNIYWREYQKGYVYANLSPNDVRGIVLAGLCRQVNHQNITSPFSGQTINTLNLPAHRAAILVKSSVTSWQ